MAPNSKTQAREEFQWLISIPQPSMVVYADGSKEKNSTAAGAGWVGYWDTSRIKSIDLHELSRRCSDMTTLP